jgi:hypothetical protein
LIWKQFLYSQILWNFQIITIWLPMSCLLTRSFNLQVNQNYKKRTFWSNNQIRYFYLKMERLKTPKCLCNNLMSFGKLYLNFYNLKRSLLISFGKLERLPIWEQLQSATKQNNAFHASRTFSFLFSKLFFVWKAD